MFDGVSVRILTSDFNHQTLPNKVYKIIDSEFGVQFSFYLPINESTIQKSQCTPLGGLRLNGRLRFCCLDLFQAFLHQRHSKRLGASRLANDDQWNLAACANNCRKDVLFQSYSLGDVVWNFNDGCEEINLFERRRLLAKF